MEVKKIYTIISMQMNHAQDYEKVIGTEEAYGGLKRARDEGLIDYIGITSHNLKVLEKAIEDGYFDVIMACYSFLEPDAAEKVFPLAKARNIGILTMKPFSGGVIGEAGPALRFVLSTPGIVPIPGSESLEKAERMGDLREKPALYQERSKILLRFKKGDDQQFCRRCNYCQPCSEKISIQRILGLKTIVKR